MIVNRILLRRVGAIALAVAALGLVGCGSDDYGGGSGGGQAAAEEVTLRAGLNDATDPTVAVLMYRGIL